VNELGLAVRGDPAGQGSWIALSAKGSSAFCNSCKKVHCRPIAIPSGSAKLSAWRKAVHKAVLSMAPAQPFEGPVLVRLRFRFLRPKKPVRNYPVPDVDKLARAVLDALTKAAYEDDRQVVSLVVVKEYVSDPELVGVIVHIQEVVPSGTMA